MEIHVVSFHWYEINGKDKFMKTESRSVVAWHWGSNRDWLQMDTKDGDRNVLKLDYGYGAATL